MKTSNGGDQLKEELADLGISIESLRGLNAGQQFEVLARSLFRVKDDAQQTRLGLALFGESYNSLIDIIKEGPEAFRENQLAVKAFGLELSQERLDTLKAADKAFKDLSLSLEGLGLSVSTVLAPAAKAIAESTTEFNKAIIEADTLTGKLEVLSSKLGKLSQFGGVLGASFGKKLGDRITGADLDSGRPIDDFLKDGGASDGTADPPINREVVTVEAKRLKEGQFTDGELRAAVTDRQRSFEQLLESNLGKYANQRAVLEDLDRGVLEGTANIFAENEQNISESLARIEDSTLASLEVQTTVLEQFGSSLAQNFSDVFVSAGDGADELGRRVLDSFKRILADAATQQLFKSLAGLGTSLSGSGGFSGAIGAGLSALFGGFKAEGGPVTAGLGYVVGERGPEFFMPRTSGTIIPNAGLRSAAPVTVNTTFNIDARGSNRDSAEMLMRELPKLLDRP